MKPLTITKSFLTENSEILKDYFKDISKYPIISKEEEVKLAKEMKMGNEQARDKLIKSNLRFVITCAKQYVNQGVPLVDLINAGNLGLCQSCNLYDPDKGYRFLSFAVWYIRREIIKAIYNTGRTIRYPITYISKITKVKKAYDKFLSDNQRDPDDDELIQLTNLTQKQYNSVIFDKSYCQSLDSPITEDEKTSIADTLTENPDPFRDSFVTDAILNALECLTPREHKVIQEFYGIGCKEKNIKELAAEMNLGEERVRQLRKEGIKKLSQRKGITLKSLL